MRLCCPFPPFHPSPFSCATKHPFKTFQPLIRTSDIANKTKRLETAKECKETAPSKAHKTPTRLHAYTYTLRLHVHTYTRTRTHAYTYVKAVSKKRSWLISFLKSQIRSGSKSDFVLLRKRGPAWELDRILAGQRAYEKPGCLPIWETKKPGSKITQTISQK